MPYLLIYQNCEYFENAYIIWVCKTCLSAIFSLMYIYYSSSSVSLSVTKSTGRGTADQVNCYCPLCSQNSAFSTVAERTKQWHKVLYGDTVELPLSSECLNTFVPGTSSVQQRPVSTTYKAVSNDCSQLYDRDGDPEMSMTRMAGSLSWMVMGVIW